MEKKDQNQQTDTEHSRCAVPLSERKSYFSLTIVWTGFVFVITSMMAGGGLAAGLDFKGVIIATLGGNIFLSMIAVLVSVIACRTGLTFALLTRYSFGLSGSKAASIFVPVVNLGWYTIQAATYGHFVARVFHLGLAGEGICMAASAIVMGIFDVWHTGNCHSGIHRNPGNRIPVHCHCDSLAGSHRRCRGFIFLFSRYEYVIDFRNYGGYRYMGAIYCYLCCGYHALCQGYENSYLGHPYWSFRRQYPHDYLRCNCSGRHGKQ